MTKYEEIIIEWEEKINIKDIKDIPILLKDKKKSLYQLYADSHIYGRDVLLYIGISENVAERLKDHKMGVFGYVNNLSVSLGEIKDYNNRLEIPESILIANHKPSYNKEFLHDLPDDAKLHKIIVINNGINCMLKTCCTNYWWVDSNNININI